MSGRGLSLPQPNMPDIRLKLSCYARKGLCVSLGEGDRLFRNIAEALAEGLRVLLVFDNIEIMTPTFLNHAIGQLYGHFSEAEIRASLSVVNATQEQLALVKRVTDNAKLYFAAKAKVS